MEYVLITGGLGYIGSHIVASLANAGYETVILDNLSNSKESTLKKISEITGKDTNFFLGDIRSSEDLISILNMYNITSCVHLAGLKSVIQSFQYPEEYYSNNVVGTLNLINRLHSKGVNKFVFSSSATVYGNNANQPINESEPLSPTNPYATTKVITENYLSDFSNSISGKDFRAIALRYFNPIGAHPSGLIGEMPQEISTNLMPYLNQVAIGQRKSLYIYGKDYSTKDGTGIRDYIHVMDLAEAHIMALNYLDREDRVSALNIGTGTGCTVLELINTYEAVNKIKINYEYTSRREGDIAISYADNQLAKKELCWNPIRTVADMCRDSWLWQNNLKDFFCE
jgi:UDP-glucose 4-epimerase